MGPLSDILAEREGLYKRHSVTDTASAATATSTDDKASASSASKQGQVTGAPGSHMIQCDLKDLKVVGTLGMVLHMPKNELFFAFELS
jgi:hypothetical protein